MPTSEKHQLPETSAWINEKTVHSRIISEGILSHVQSVRDRTRIRTSNGTATEFLHGV